MYLNTLGAWEKIPRLTTCECRQCSPNRPAQTWQMAPYLWSMTHLAVGVWNTKSFSTLFTVKKGCFFAEFSGIRKGQEKDIYWFLKRITLCAIWQNSWQRQINFHDWEINLLLLYIKCSDILLGYCSNCIIYVSISFNFSDVNFG